MLPEPKVDGHAVRSLFPCDAMQLHDLLARHSGHASPTYQCSESAPACCKNSGPDAACSSSLLSPGTVSGYCLSAPFFDAMCLCNAAWLYRQICETPSWLRCGWAIATTRFEGMALKGCGPSPHGGIEGMWAIATTISSWSASTFDTSFQCPCSIRI